MPRRISPQRSALETIGLTSIALLAFTLAGCADMTQPGFYNPPKASSATDAQANATDAYALQSIQAPSQIQIDLRQPSLNNQIPIAPPSGSATSASGATPPDVTQGSAAENIPAANTAMAQAALIPEPMSFAGTVPCFNAAMQCTAQRIMLTLAPNGRWRARATYLEQNTQSGKPQAEQGCWRTLMGSPARVAILTAEGTPRAEFAAPNDNLLRLMSLNGQTPNLTYTLSRQPDLDPIKELDQTPAPNCP